MAQVPLTVKITLPGNIALPLNDNNIELVSVQRKPNEKSKGAYYLYESVEETLTINVLGSGASYQRAQDGLDSLIRYVETAQNYTRGNTTYRPTLQIIPSGGANGYAALLKSIELDVPDTSMDIAVLGGLPNTKLTYTRSPFYDVLDTTSAANISTVSTSGSIPGVFTVSGIKQAHYSSPISYRFGQLAHQYQRSTPSGYIAVSNNPFALKMVSMFDGGTHTGFVTGFESSATGSVVRFPSGQINASGVYYLTDAFATNYPVNNITPVYEFNRVHVFGSIRCSGTYAVTAGLSETVSTNVITTYADTQYFSNMYQPTVVYMGTITSERHVYGSPTYAVKALSTSGYFDVDYLAFVGMPDENTSILRVQPISLSGLSPGSIALLQAPLGTFTYGNVLTFDAKPHVIYAKAVSAGNPSLYNDVMVGSITDQQIIQHAGSAYPTWRSYHPVGLPDYTAAVTTAQKTSAYSMFLATGSGGQWGYQTISGVPLNVRFEATVATAYPYMPRI